MSDQELFEKNLELSTEFSKYLLGHPELESKIPQEAQVLFLVDSDPDLSRKNMEMARKQKAGGQSVVFVHVKGLRAEISRLIDPHLETVPAF